MRELISSIFVLLCMSVHAENTYFSSFLSKLVFTSKSSVTDSTFGKPQIEDLLDKKAFGKYLPILADDCNCDEDEILWQGGTYMKKGNYVVAFMQRFNTDCKDGSEKWFMEHVVGDYVMVVYSKTGTICDSKIIGKSSFVHFARISGDITSGIAVDQGLLADASQLHTYKPLDYEVSKHSFTVNASGMIEENVSKTWKEIKEQKQEDSSEDTTFNNYLKYFERWDKSLVDDSVYRNNGVSELPHSLVTAFLSSLQECDCWAKDIVWSACKYIEKERYYILFVLRGCDFPKKVEPLYTEKIILTYDKAGKCIDYCILGKISDDESVNISNGSDSQRIMLDKGVAVRANEYTIDIEGRIHSSTSNLKN